MNDGPYSVYGASGVIGSMSVYQNSDRYVAVVKDGAGVGRARLCRGNTSVLGTMQALIPVEGVLPEYLLHLVRAMRLGDEFTGSTIPHIYFKDYGQREVRWVSLEDQGRIAAILEAVEKQICSSRQQLTELDTLVKSRFVEMFGDLEGYKSVPLGRCVERVESGKSPKCLSVARADGVPAVLKLSSISSGVYRESENKALPSDADLDIGKVVREGDILLARKNTPELVGRSVLVKHTGGSIMFPDIVFRMHPVSDVDGFYLAHLLAGPLFGSLRSLAHGSAKSMSNIPKSELVKLLIPLPPLALQQEFADFVAQVDKSRFVVQLLMGKYNDAMTAIEKSITR